MRQFLIRREHMSNKRSGYAAGILVLFTLILGALVLDLGLSDTSASAQSKIQNPKSKILDTSTDTPTETTTVEDTPTDTPTDSPTSTPACGLGWNIVPSLNTGMGWNTL